jgi:RHS repeat-associated protein
MSGSGQSGGGGAVQWLVSDHLGTPRMVADQTGALSGIKRHDYLPFGEEIGAGVGGRTAGRGYVADSVRQQFAGYERDDEAGLDFAQARYYAHRQGRFTSVDPEGVGSSESDPQSYEADNQ